MTLAHMSFLAVGVCVLAAVAASGDSPIIIETGAASPNAKVTSIAITGLSDAARDELTAKLRVHVGDILYPEGKYQIATAVQQFDERLSIEIVAAGDSLSIRIAAGGAPAHILTPPSTAAGGRRLTMGSGAQSHSILSKVQPVYPQSARQACIQGVETLHVLIGTDGTVKFVQAVSGHPLLTPAAVEAVRQWTFQPARVNGEALEVESNVEVPFTLPPGSTCPDAPGHGGHE